MKEKSTGLKHKLGVEKKEETRQLTKYQENGFSKQKIQDPGVNSLGLDSVSHTSCMTLGKLAF